MTTRFILSSDQRQEIKELLDCDEEAMFLQIEEILTDFGSNKTVLDDLPKAAETRDIFAQISKYAREGRIKMLNKKIDELHDDKKWGDKRMRWARIEYELTFGKKLSADDLDELSRNTAQLSNSYTNRKTPRRTDQIRHARDFALEELVEVFNGYASGGDIPAERIDKCEAFIVEMLGYANIPTPAASGEEVFRGEHKQSRLRRIIKSYL